MSRCVTLFLAAVLCLIPLAAMAEDILNIGDAAPKLAVSDWVKGDKIDRLDSDKTYVVEFWATWCGPCRSSIPHLTELAHQYKDKPVQFVGVDVWENDPKQVQSFVDEMGDKMDYHVAIDKIAGDNTEREGEMAKTWLRAAEEHGIPSAFVIREGKIAWIGHPMGLEEPLAKITAGQWDPGDLAAKRLERKTQERKVAAVRAKVYTPYREKDYKAALAAIQEITKDDPGLADQFQSVTLASLCNSGDIEQGLNFGESVFEKNKDNANALNNDFWDLINPQRVDEVDPRVAKLALKAASRAVELTGEKDPNCLDTLAEAQFCTGDVEAAVTTEEKTIELIKSKFKDLPEGALKPYNDRLERYRKRLTKS